MNALFRNTPAHDNAALQKYSDISIILPTDFRLESGEALSRPELRLRVYGDASQPAVVVSGGISSGRAVADADAVDGVVKGWWRDIAHVEGAVDLNNFCVIAFDFLPNPEEIAGTISTLDQARALAHALGVLKIKRLHAFVGASYGGMVALAFAAAFPEQLDKLCVISAAERAHPAATAVRGVQRRIVEFAKASGNSEEGVALARQLAMITYRTPEEFEQRFDNTPGEHRDDPFEVCEYLISRGNAFGMDAERYLTLSASIDRHTADPSKINADSFFIAVHSDRLVPPADIRRLADTVQGARFSEIDSLYGHDAFLKETATLGPAIKAFLEEHSS